MTFHIKICGLKDPALADCAIDAGADMIGLVFFDKSPRYLQPEGAAHVALAARGRAATVGLFVNPTDTFVTEVTRKIPLTHLQLHGSETPERVSALRQRHNLPVIKACGLAQPEDLASAAQYHAAADMMLFDTRAPADAVLPGGNGESFDWQLLKNATGDLPWLLAGGLTTENVAAAIRAVHKLPGFAGVDVSSGVERQRGDKDAGLIRDFIANAKAALEGT